MNHSIPRRAFLARSGALAAAAAFTPRLPAEARRADQETPQPTAPPALFRSVKWGMIKAEGGVAGRFRLMKEVGFDGMELVSPLGGIDHKELLAARDATGLPIHGVVDMVHWQADHRLSSPDRKARERGRKALEQAIRDCHALGGSSVLLVPGRVTDQENENHDQVWARSQEEIRKALPLAARLGVHILIENVWNGFCYRPELLAEYLDGFASPWVGSYLDLGNHVRYGLTQHWIKVLGRRITKLDCKDWSKEKGFCHIGDGDCAWADVRKALAEIGYCGWVTAEVQGGSAERLADVLARMRRVLG